MTEDRFKGDWHIALAVVFGASAAYNLMRFAATRKGRNAVNAALYAGLALWEVHQAKHHWARPCGGTSRSTAA